jgi:hypothetical protein
MSGEFRFKVGERVWYQPSMAGSKRRRVRIIARTIEPALGKTYQVRSPKMGGMPYVCESELSPDA